MSELILTTYDWVPEVPRGYVRDLRVRWALEEAGLPYRVETTPFKDRGPDHLAHHPFAQVPYIKDGDQVVFESGAILMHLAEKFGAFLPTDRTRAEVLSWLFWQVGSAPFIGGGFGHFYAYAPEKFEYPINRYAMETKRLFDVADQRLGESRFLAGEDYTIADIATFAWLAPFVEGNIYSDAKTFLSIDEYANVARWVEEIAARPAVQRGRIVTKVWGDEDSQLRERHSAADFEGKVLTPSKPV